MRRRVLANLLLAGAVAALAALLLLIKPAPETPPPPPLTAIPADSIHTIHVERTEGGPMNFERRGGVWLMTAPVAATAYPARISAVLGLLNEPSHAQLDAGNGDLARFKLDAPVVRLLLDAHAFDFGDTDPLEERRYVRVDGRIHLIADTLFFQLTQNPGFFIDPKLLSGDAPLKRIAYPQFTLIEEGGKWRQEPDAGLAADKLKEVSLNWESARGVTVRTPIEGTASGQIMIDTGAGTPVRFEILSQDGNVILGRADLNVQYHLDSYTAEQLLLKEKEVTPKTSGSE